MSQVMSSIVRNSWQDEEIRRNRIEGLRSYWADPANKKKCTERMLRVHEAVIRPDVQKRRSKTLKATLRKKSVKAQQCYSQRKRWAKPGAREAHSKVMKKVITREVRKRISETEKEQFKHGRKLTGAAIFPVKVSKNEYLLVAALVEQKVKCIHQFKVPETRYTADIFIPSSNLIVEIDGHPSHYTYRRKFDIRRDKILRGLGYHVLHLKTKEIKKGISFCLVSVLYYIERLRLLKDVAV
jgi:very-short-patch-repair endonuclease